ncbi:MAG: hypothetical protein MJY87_04725 [Fibrobacter sp.]|nr:hypothetical protein [Fibrobacter sp.]
MICNRLILAIFLAVSCSMANFLDTLFFRLKVDYSSEVSEKDVSALLLEQRLDGTWPGPEYHKKGHTPIEHLKKARTLAESYEHSCMDSSEGKNASELERCGVVRAALEKSLYYWFIRRNDFVSDNWWMNEIGIPRELATIAFLTWNEISVSLRPLMIESFPQEPSGNGANRTWISELVVVRGILEGRDSLVRRGLRTIEETMKVTGQEGHQRDHSYFMHGNLLYNGGYGKIALSIAARWAALCRGTPYAFDRENITAMTDLALEGNRWMMWRGMVDPMVLGREISRRGGNKEASAYGRIIDNLLQVDSSRGSEYRAWRGEISGENHLSGCRYFERGQLMVCRSGEYFVSLRMSSKNTVGSESINRENRKGFWLGAGVLSVYRHPDDFRNIYPLWNWGMLPGVTSSGDGTQNEKRVTNRSEMVNGLTDGSDGVATMMLDYGSVTARKVWIFLEGTVVALGNGIAETSGKETFTTVDQRLVHSEVIVEHGNGLVETLPENKAVVSRRLWHDEIAYTDLDGNGFSAVFLPQAGNWKSIGTEKAEESAKVLKIWESHGRNPRAASYAYQVDLPVPREKFRGGMPEKVRVLQNDSVAQVVYDERRGVFAGSINASVDITFQNEKLSFESPCVFIQKDGARKVKKLTSS